MASTSTPRVVVSATGSGAGKTTIAAALMAALRARGMKVAPFKCGPDYLDPSYHARAAGCKSHNLDGWMMGREGVLNTFASAARDADIAVIEGMMGLYDSVEPTSDEGSTAEVAKWLDAPLLLVTDASGMARSVGAIATGFANFDSEVLLAGLICNRLGGRGHLELLRQVPSIAPVLGGLPADPTIVFPERHLGLLEANETVVPQKRFDALAAMVPEWFDIDRIMTIARATTPLDFTPLISSATPPRCRIALAYDEAFHFYYEYNLELLRQLGAELVRFSPVHDSCLPRVDGLYLGGGYPEHSAEQLSANTLMIESIREFAASGKPTYGECGGLMYLLDGIRTLDGRTWPMVGLLPGVAIMHDRLQAIGYVEVETTAPSFLGPAGTRWRGHQFRYSELERVESADHDEIYRVCPRWGGAPFTEGPRHANVIGSYVHAHWASNPAPAKNFVHACMANSGAHA